MYHCTHYRMQIDIRGQRPAHTTKWKVWLAWKQYYCQLTLHVQSPRRERGGGGGGGGGRGRGRKGGVEGEG